MRDEIVDALKMPMNRVTGDGGFLQHFQAAEEFRLTVRPAPIRTTVLMGEICGTFLHREAMAGKVLSVAPSAEDRVFSSDKNILFHSLSALVQNALEATTLNGRVTVDCTSVHHGVQFSIHNDGCVPADHRVRIFQKNFSTKAEDRGQGTYACKLLVEKYLDGRTWFESDHERGTVFFISLPERIVGRL